MLVRFFSQGRHVLARWYFLEKGKPTGPYSRDEILEKIREGQLQSSDLLYCEGDSRWRRASEIRDFQSKLTGNLKPVHSGEPVWVLLVRKRDGSGYKQKGPFSADAIRRMLHEGEVSFTDYVWRDGYKEWYKIVALPEFHLATMDDGHTAVVRHIPENVMIQKPVTPPEPEDDEITAVVEDPTDPDGNTAEIDLREEDQEITRKIRVGNVAVRSPKILARVARISFVEYFFGLSYVQRTMVVGAGILIAASATLIVSVFSSFADRGNQKLIAPKKPQVAPNTREVHVAKAAEPVGTSKKEEAPKPPPPPPPEPKVAPTFLKLNAMNTGEENATVGIVTNASSHFPVTLTFSNEAGRSLGSKSYEKTIVLRKLTDRNYQLRLAKLPAGYFRIDAKVGEFTATTEIFYDTKNSEFQEAYRRHRKQLSREHNEERYSFVTTAGRFETQAWQLFQGVQNSRGKSAWRSFYKSWRKNVTRIKDPFLDRFTAKRKKDFVHGEKWSDLKSLKNELLDWGQKFNRGDLKADASEIAEMKDLAQRFGKIKERMIGATLWGG